MTRIEFCQVFKYFINLTGDPDSLKAELDNSALFDSTKTIPNIVLNSCSNPFTPNDPGVLNWANDVIEVECAWSIEQGDPSIIAAVVDTRFDTAHPDLEDKLVSVWGTPGSNDHGISMAGAIAAEPNNNYCIAGVGYNTKVAGYCHSNSGVTAWTAVWQAYQDGRPVINCSWSTSTDFWQPHIAAVYEMLEDGVVIVVSSGTETGDNAHNDAAPIDGVIKVSLIDENENFPSWWGEQRDLDVDISAPGANGVEALRGWEEGYCSPNSGGGGTSIAAAHVSGTVALLLSANSCLTPAEIEGIIKATSKPVLNGDDPQDPYYGRVGKGYINVYNAVRMAKADPDPINDEKTWDYPVYINGSLIIEEGGHLTISSHVRFGPNGKIVVKRGGELFVNGGHLANGCGDRWQGIIVEGNNSLHQGVGIFTGVRDQGYVQLNNATIENAMYGIRVYNPDPNVNSFSTSGGIVKANGTKFINNILAVDFAPYQNYSELFGHNIGNLSFFSACDFLIDSEFPGDPDDFITHVNLRRVTGIEFYGCSFKNEIDHNLYSFADDAKFALTAIDADFLVTYKCNSSQYPCTSYKPSLFEGFATAISAFNYSTLNTFRVSYTDFVDNYTAISASKIDNPYIVKNTFSVGMDLPGLYNPYKGIQLHRSTGFKVEENEFYSSPNALLTEETIGIVTIFSGEQPNEIYKNDFENIDFANLSNGDNRGASLNDGLVYYCNTNNNNQYDFAVPDEGNMTWGVSISQGSLLKAAGNSFSSNPLNDQTHFLNHAGPFDYFTPPSPQEYTVSSITLVNGSANTCSSQLPDDKKMAVLSETEKSTFRCDYFTGTDISEKYYASNMLIRDFLVSDTIQDLDSVRVWLINKGDLLSRLAVVDSWLQENQPDSAFQALDNIPNQIPLTGESLSEYYFFDTLKTIQINAQQSGMEDEEMIIENYYSIKSIADSGNFLASVQAQNMINSIYGPVYEPLIVLPRDTSISRSLKEVEADEGNNVATFTAFPNPARDITLVEFQLPKQIENGKLVFSALDGTIIEQQQITGNSGKIAFNTTALLNGVYFFTLLSEDKKWKTLKVVIAR